jgi:hypothetical protein
MKTLLIILTLGTLTCAGCYAQNKFPEGVSTVKNEQFKIEYTDWDKDFIVVYNVKSRHTKAGPESDDSFAPPIKRDDIHFDKTAPYTIIQKVLKPRLEKLHKNEDFVHIILVFEKSGKLSDVSYGLKKSTLISLEEIAEIDTRLRNSIVAAFTGDDYKKYKFIIYRLGTISF